MGLRPTSPTPGGFVPPRAANPCVYRSFTRVTVVPMQQTRSAAFPITDKAAMGATLRPERKTYKHHRFLHQADQGFNGSLQTHLESGSGPGWGRPDAFASGGLPPPEREHLSPSR